jgi:hypothetical protein
MSWQCSCVTVEVVYLLVSYGMAVVWVWHAGTPAPLHHHVWRDDLGSSRVSVHSTDGNKYKVIMSKVCQELNKSSGGELFSFGVVFLRPTTMKKEVPTNWLSLRALQYQRS